MRIGELAEATGTTTKTLRFYEDSGLLPPPERTVSGYRDYDRAVTIEVDGWQVGLATCYDVRFADHFTALGRAGAQLVVLPASWGDGPGKASQWDLLTRARAHDAQAWLLGVGQAWTADSVRGPYGIGRSVLADPTGEVRARLGGGEDVLVAEVDRDLVDRTRATIPLL